MLLSRDPHARAAATTADPRELSLSESLDCIAGGLTVARGGDTDPSLGLSGLFQAGEFPGSLGEYLEQLETQYRAIVSGPGICLWGKPVVAGAWREADGRDHTFWHLITTGKGARRLDLRRCALLPRVRDLLERLAAGDPRVCWWRERRCRIMVAPVDFSLTIILIEKPEAYILATAYPATKPRKRAKLMDRAAAACGAAS